MKSGRSRWVPLGSVLLLLLSGGLALAQVTGVVSDARDGGAPLESDASATTATTAIPVDGMTATADDAGAIVEDPDAAAEMAADAGSPRDIARRARVLLTVGTETLTVGEFEDLLNGSPAPLRQFYAETSARREFLERISKTFMLAQESRRRGIDKQPEVAGSIRRILSNALTTELVIRAITPESVTDAEVAAYYTQHESDYNTPEFRRATVVVLSDRATADQVATEARAANGDMRLVRGLVEQRSVDAATKARDGDVYYFDHIGKPLAADPPTDPAVASAVFALSTEMEVAGPIQDAQGRWVVAVLTGMRPALRRTLSDPGTAAGIRAAFVNERRSKKDQELVQTLRTAHPPEVHEERLDLIKFPREDLGGIPMFDPGNGPPRREPGSTSGASPVPSVQPGTSDAGL